jgi:hypothetical protein
LGKPRKAIYQYSFAAARIPRAEWAASSWHSRFENAPESRRHDDLAGFRVGSESGEHLIEPLTETDVEIEKQHLSAVYDASPAAADAETFFADFEADLTDGPHRFFEQFQSIHAGFSRVGTIARPII